MKYLGAIIVDAGSKTAFWYAADSYIALKFQFQKHLTLIYTTRLFLTLLRCNKCHSPQRR